ncbi:hypothetical protein GCAAIG_05110 [Candidatus Electronema halotolerans]
MISENKESASCYVAYLQLKDSEKIKNELIVPKVQEFFRQRNINYEDCKEIRANKDISDLDFEKQGIDYFYENIFYDISKGKNGEIELSVKYCITLDKTNCTKQCSKTSIYYDEILLSKTPVFYFIYISIDEIFAFLRTGS